MSNTMDDDDKLYPNAEPDGLGDLKEIKRLPGMQPVAPDIRWGDEFGSWPIEQRLSYAKRLASSMNHAADILQQERNALLLKVAEQEEKLMHAAKVYLQQGDVMHHELANNDVEKQQLYQQIVDLTTKVKQLTKRIAELEKA